MAVVYQVRYPSVSGTGADWRNLELSPLPLSNDRYILNERRYHQPRELRHWAIVKGTKLHIYPKLNHSNLICGLNLKWILYLFKATPSAQFWRKRAHKKARPFLPNVYIARQGGTHTLGPHVGPRRLVLIKDARRSTSLRIQMFLNQAFLVFICLIFDAIK